MKTLTEQFRKKRKFLGILPLLALPFVTLAFWSVGGGRGPGVQHVEGQQGLNKVLPEAKLSTDATDKMSLYNQADKDSLALEEQLKADPYARKDSLAATGSQPYDPYQFQREINPGGGYLTGHSADPNEARITSKLAQLDQALRQSPPPVQEPSVSASSSADQERLQKMMEAASSGSQPDPQMEQLDGMLDKLLDIQNPARAQLKIKEQSQKNRGQVFAVSKTRPSVDTDLIGSNDSFPSPLKTERLAGTGMNAFYDIDPGISSEDSVMQTAISAVVNETQTLVSGSAVKMMLTEDVFINGQRIPAGNFVSGTCTVEGERLKIQVGGLRYGKSIFPVTLSAYDLDAIEGIRIPGAISRDASKDGADRAIQSVQLMSMDPSIAAQAATAGVEAAKGLFSKKVKLIRVTVKAGHPLLLLDAKTKQGLN